MLCCTKLSVVHYLESVVGSRFEVTIVLLLETFLGSITVVDNAATSVLCVRPARTDRWMTSWVKRPESALDPDYYTLNYHIYSRNVP